MKKTAGLADLSSLDMGQLHLLHLLLTGGSVTAAAESLGVSQPAVSLRLARLREIFGDPLLVRAGAGMVPTERGRSLIEPLGAIFDGLARLAEGEGPFEPASSRRQFRIAAPNYMGAFLLPGLAAAVTEAAPGIRLSLQTIVPGRDYEESLATGEIDLLIGNWPEVPGHLRGRALPDDRLVCVLAADHPRAAGERLALADYLEADHISPSAPADWRFSPVDAQLMRMRRARRVAVVLPDYTLIPQLVAATRLVLTTGARFAPFARRTAEVAVVEAPAEFRPVRFRMLWHERSHADEGHAWLRGLMREVALSRAGPMAAAG